VPENVDHVEHRSYDSRGQAVIHRSVIQQKLNAGVLPKGNYDFKGGDGGCLHVNGEDLIHHLPSISPNFTNNKMQSKETTMQSSSRTLTSIP